MPDGASFADGFFNDAGVVVATNWCGDIFEADRMEVKDGSIGYGIRRLVAERAHSADEGVQIAIFSEAKRKLRSHRPLNRSLEGWR